MRKYLIALAGLLAAVGTVLGMTLSAGAASASTNGCSSASTTHNGVTGNFCGSQEITNGGVNLDLSVPNKAGAYARLTFKAATDTNSQEDFAAFNPAVAPDNQKLLEWSPFGSPSGLYVTVSNNGALPVLKALKNGGTSAGQQWVANEVSGGFTWTSELNGKSISDPNALAFTRATLVTIGGSAFNFVS